MTTEAPIQTFRAKARMVSCVPGKGYITVDGKSVQREIVTITMMGVKDEVFGPATPYFDLKSTIQNPELAQALRKAFEEYFLESEGSVGVEFEIDFRIIGPSAPDTY